LDMINNPDKNIRFYPTINVLTPVEPTVTQPTTPAPTPQRRASDKVSTKTTAADRDRPQILADELAFTQRRLDALKNTPENVSPKRANETDAAWKARVAEDIARANADVLSLTGALKAVTK